MRAVLILGGVVLLIGNAVLGAILFTESTPNTPASSVLVVLKEDGYEPAELTVARGTSVTFSTTVPRMHWPASNLHPSHGIYPEFDPRRPLEPTETWTFVFDKVGEWRFHDHLAPYYTGIIVVSES